MSTENERRIRHRCQVDAEEETNRRARRDDVLPERGRHEERLLAVLLQLVRETPEPSNLDVRDETGLGRLDRHHAGRQVPDEDRLNAEGRVALGTRLEFAPSETFERFRIYSVMNFAANLRETPFVNLCRIHEEQCSNENDRYRRERHRRQTGRPRRSPTARCMLTPAEKANRDHEKRRERRRNRVQEPNLFGEATN